MRPATLSVPPASPPPGPGGPDRRFTRRDALVVAGLFAVAFGAFAPALGYDFVGLDDGEYVMNNAAVRSGLTADGVEWAWTSVAAANWHPLTWMSLELDTTLYGTAPFGYHLTNVLLHALNTGLLYLTLRRLTGAVGRSLVVALLFGLHPLRVESVAWVTERKDVLSGLFAILAVLAYAGPDGRGPTRWGLWRVAVLMALSLLAKPMAVTLPFALLLLDAWPLGRLRSRADVEPLVREKTVLFLLTVASCFMTAAVQNGSGAMQSAAGSTILARIENATAGYGAYLRLTVWPSGLAALYPLAAAADRPAWHLATAAAVLVGATGAAWAYRRSAPHLLVGWLWFLGTLVPVIGLLQVGSQSHADRYTYIPHIGLFLALVWGAADVIARWRLPVPLRAAVAAAAAGVCLVLTREQLPHWRDNHALWARMAAVTEKNAMAWRSLALNYLSRGDVDEALACYDRACEAAPGDDLLAAIRETSYLKYGREKPARIGVTAPGRTPP